MLKFEDKFKIGDEVKVHDFDPCLVQHDIYLIGEIIDTVIEKNIKCYQVNCTYCSMNKRLGETILVPMEVAMFEFDKRIELIQEASN